MVVALDDAEESWSGIMDVCVLQDTPDSVSLRNFQLVPTVNARSRRWNFQHRPFSGFNSRVQPIFQFLIQWLEAPSEQQFAAPTSVRGNYPPRGKKRLHAMPYKAAAENLQTGLQLSRPRWNGPFLASFSARRPREWWCDDWFWLINLRSHDEVQSS